MQIQTTPLQNIKNIYLTTAFYKRNENTADNNVYSRPAASTILPRRSAAQHFSPRRGRIVQLANYPHCSP